MRVGARFVPVIGWGLLAYDIVNLLPSETLIGPQIAEMRGRAGVYAWDGGSYLSAANGTNTNYLIGHSGLSGSALDLQLAANAARSEIFADTARQLELQTLPYDNTALAGAFIDRADTTVGHINAAAARGDAAEIEAILEEYRAESARQEEEFRAGLTAIPAVGPTEEGNVSVTGTCRPIRICFWPAARFRRGRLGREFERQLENQQNAINAMSPATLVSNRDAYCNPATRPALQSAAAASRNATRRLYAANLTAAFRAIPRVGRVPGAARAAAQRRMRGGAALHNPDMIAGGGPLINPASVATVNPLGNVEGFGNERVNQSIGSSWGTCANADSRSSRLRDHAERQAAAGCPSTQAELAVCRN